MRIRINYLDNDIIITNDKVNVLEVENKKFFYRIVNNFYELSNGNDIEEISGYVDCDEVNLKDKIKIFTNYFNFELNSKKNISDLTKYIINFIEDDNKIVTEYRKMLRTVNKELNKIDLPLYISADQTIDYIIKSLKIFIKQTDDLLSNLLLIIDLERLLNINSLLIFIDLKQYLEDEELKELYKYSIYNGINIILIDSINHGVTKEYESKLIIDNNLDEFVL